MMFVDSKRICATLSCQQPDDKTVTSTRLMASQRLEWIAYGVTLPYLTTVFYNLDEYA